MCAAPFPSVSVTYAQTGASMQANAHGMRPMQERAYQKRGEPSRQANGVAKPTGSRRYLLSD